VEWFFDGEKVTVGHFHFKEFILFTEQKIPMKLQVLKPPVNLKKDWKCPKAKG
jgi:hypothetical protein